VFSRRAARAAAAARARPRERAPPPARRRAVTAPRRRRVRTHPAAVQATTMSSAQSYQRRAPLKSRFRVQRGRCEPEPLFAGDADFLPVEEVCSRKNRLAAEKLAATKASEVCRSCRRTLHQVAAEAYAQAKPPPLRERDLNAETERPAKKHKKQEVRRAGAAAALLPHAWL